MLSYLRGVKYTDNNPLSFATITAIFLSGDINPYSVELIFVTGKYRSEINSNNDFPLLGYCVVSKKIIDDLSVPFSKLYA